MTPCGQPGRFARGAFRRNMARQAALVSCLAAVRRASPENRFAVPQPNISRSRFHVFRNVSRAPWLTRDVPSMCLIALSEPPSEITWLENAQTQAAFNAPCNTPRQRGWCPMGRNHCGFARNPSAHPSGNSPPPHGWCRMGRTRSAPQQTPHLRKTGNSQNRHGWNRMDRNRCAPGPFAARRQRWSS